jgi:hypothetical protein
MILVHEHSVKLGGINHSTTNVRINMQNTILLGADLSHPGPGAIQGYPSIAAIVGSVDDDGGKFLGSMRLQTLAHSDREVIVLLRQSQNITYSLRSFTLQKIWSSREPMHGTINTSSDYQKISSTTETVSVRVKP